MNPDFFRSRFQFALEEVKEKEYAIHVHADEVNVIDTITNSKFVVPIDFESAEKDAPVLVYGTIVNGNFMYDKEKREYIPILDAEKLKAFALRMKQHGLICVRDIKDNKKTLVVSGYQDILFSEPQPSSHFRSVVPFAAYMHTKETIGKGTATPMFVVFDYSPESQNSVGMSFLNRQMLLCCQKAVPFKEGTTLENWKEQVDESLLNALPGRLAYVEDDMPEYQEVFWDMLDNTTQLLFENGVSPYKTKKIISGLLSHARVTPEEASEEITEFKEANELLADILKEYSKA